MENISAPTDNILNSSPSKGNTESPPTVPNIVASGVVQAGQPGVKAVKTLPAVVELPDFFMLSNAAALILKIIIETLTPAKMAITNVKPTDVTRKAGPIISETTENGIIESVKK